MHTVEAILERKGCGMLKVADTASVRSVVELLAENKIGAAIITRDERIVGIWTERDLLRNVIKPGFDLDSSRVGDFMSTNLKSVEARESIYAVMDKLLGLRIRHLLITRDENYIGILSIGDVVRAALTSKSKELEQLNSIVSWEYYEHWKHIPDEEKSFK